MFDSKKISPNIFGAIIGFFLGLVFSRNFIVAVILMTIGYFVGSSFKDVKDGKSRNSNLDYIKELLALVSIILTKDKKILQSELNYVKRFLKHNFSEEEARKYLLIFRDYTKKTLPLEKICARLNLELHQSGKRQILHLVIGAAVADRKLTKAELADLYRIGRNLNLSRQTVDSLLSLHNYNFEGNARSDYQQNYQQRSRQSVRPKYANSLKNAYRVLEISENATDAEVKKAFRNLAIINHPDKVSHMGANMEKSAKEKFQKITEAYEQIKDSRNMN